MSESRMSWAAAERIASELSDRDRAIFSDVEKVRVLTGGHISRLHFHELTGAHRDRTRRRVLGRLATLGILTTLDRRIGGERAGSSGLVYALGTVGQRVTDLLFRDDRERQRRPRRPDTPTDRFLGHCLAVSELYVQLVEQQRQHGFGLYFAAEPLSWWRDRRGGWVKPDAYVVLEAAGIRDCWGIEIDRATESLPTVQRKLLAYLELANRSETAPGSSVLPRVLVTVPHERRRAAVEGIIQHLPEPAEQLFSVTLQETAATYLSDALRE